MKDLLTRVSLSVAVALPAGALVLLVGLTRGTEYQGRVSLLAGPVAAPEAVPQYGEVVSLALPALVELARSPSVLQAAAPASGYRPDELAERVSVELVPASGLARLSVRASSAEQAGGTATALGKAMIDADLLAPAGKLRLLDPRPEVIAVAPDAPLVTGLALVAAVAAGLATAALRRLSPAGGTGSVRRALAAAGLHRPVSVLREGDPGTPDRLAVLCRAAGRAVRVLPVSPDLTETAAKLAAGLPDSESGDGSSVVAVAAGGRGHDELTATVAVLPGDAVLVAVVLT
ncbi:hypothetical protein [Amycolatopsis sp. NPDC051371]|uniref:hypothetical protein n=1 Tax=Amycolatopsis sp. NPDC051371 TaxID=3155800 RepID=UPI00341E099B